MQKSILIALSLTFNSAVFASSFAGFTGGMGDGYAHGDFIMPQLPSVASHFLGGVRDGYAHGDFITPQLASVASHFLGGSRDGYASSIWLGYQPAATPAQARFAGNGYDGYASSKMLSAWSQIKPKRFLGGSFDGYDRNATFGIPNWTLSDTVGDGIPDWWRAQYFGGSGTRQMPLPVPVVTPITTACPTWPSIFPEQIQPMPIPIYTSWVCPSGRRREFWRPASLGSSTRCCARISLPRTGPPSPASFEYPLQWKERLNWTIPPAPPTGFIV